MSEEVSRDMTGEADEIYPGVDSRRSVICKDVNHIQIWLIYAVEKT